MNSKLLFVIAFASLIFIFNSTNDVFAEHPIQTEKSQDSFHKGTIEWVIHCNIGRAYSSTVRVIDYDMNQDPEKIEQFNIEVWSDYEDRIVDYTVTETGNSTGIFDSTIFYKTTDESSGGRVRAFPDSIVFVKYVDYTLPNGDTENNIIDTFVKSEFPASGWRDGDMWKITYDPCMIEYLDKNKNSLDWFSIFYPSPLKQIESGLNNDEIQCKESLILVAKHDGSPACVKPMTKQYLIDRDWAKIKSLDEIQDNPDLIKQNIIDINYKYVTLYPVNMCSSIILKLLTEEDIQRFTIVGKGLKDNLILQITDEDLKEIPDIQELIYAVHSIEFPYSKHSSTSLDGMTFVEYEFFLMDNAMKKYGDSQKDYFTKLDKDYEERFTNPVKQGFTNHFKAPIIIYNDNVYSIGGTMFWMSNEHDPISMSVSPKDSIEDDEKFITLTDEDMKSIPRIKEAIENIGTVKESIFGNKGLPEDQSNEYIEWFKQKSQDRLNVDKFRLIQYDEQIYSVGFSIC